MAWDEEEHTTTYHVVVNHEEQYSIWPDYKEIPKGWRAVGKTGTAILQPNFFGTFREKGLKK